MTINLTRQSDFVSFDGAVSITTAHQRPDRYRHLESLEKQSPRIARGGGYAYSAASFGKNVIVQEMTLFNRFLEFDARQLTLRVESGVRLIDLLTWAIQRQLYFPVIPGYPLITVGGCVAADVHGKNPYRDGTFSDWVRMITVFHPDKGYQLTSPVIAPDLFSLTCGGFGLTGIITDVTLQLVRLPANHVLVSQQPLANLGMAVERLTQGDDDFSYSWHDGTPGSRFGKGILFSGRWGPNDPAGIPLDARYMTAESRGTLPFCFWNTVTARMANFAFDLRSRYGKKSSEMNILTASFPFASNTLYHKLFGRPGLREMQVLIPDQQISQFLESLEQLVRDTSPPTMMISIKRFNGQQKSLSMTGSGYLVAIDCFQSAATEQFSGQLDNISVAHQGQPNLTKDSRLPQVAAECGIRHYRDFCAGLNQYDPSRLFRSELSARIGL